MGKESDEYGIITCRSRYVAPRRENIPFLTLLHFAIGSILAFEVKMCRSSSDSKIAGFAFRSTSGYSETETVKGELSIGPLHL